MLFIYIGAALLVVGIVGGALFPYPHGDWTRIFGTLPAYGMVSIAVGVFARLLIPSRRNGNDKTSIATNTSTHERDFTFFRNALIAGFVIWIPIFVSSIMLGFSTDGRSFFAQLPAYASLIALPFAIICLIAAYKTRNADLKRATLILKLPFYFALICIVAILCSHYFGFLK